MASYYFDLNGSTAGFGTLTGAWNTSSAFWSTSSAGTAVPAAVTFNSADTANFGFAGTTATAGTATIADGITVTLNSIVTANLAGLQTIARTTSGALTLALNGAVVPVINVGSAGGLTISAPIGGTNGLTKSGANTLTLSGANTFSGSVSISAGTLSITNASGLGSNTARSITVTSGAVLSLGASITGSNLTPDISGTGISGVSNGALVLATAFGTANIGAITLGASASFRAAASATLSSSILTASGRDLTLQAAPTFTGTFSGAITGAGALIVGGTANAVSQTGTVTVSSLTNGYTGDTTVSTGTMTVSGLLGSGSYAGNIAIASGATFSFTSTSNQTLSGTISGLGTLTKTTGTSSVLTLSGSNTFSASPNIHAGIVSVATIGNASANSPLGTNGTLNLGTGTTTGTLRYTGSGETTNKVVNLSSTSTGGATIEQNGSGALTFSANITGASSASNRTLTLQGTDTSANSFAGVIANVGGGAGGTALTKSGVGYWKATGANSYTGNVLVSGGQLDVTALTTLGSLAAAKTISITTASARNASALLNVATTYPSTLSWSLSSGGVDQTNAPLGAMRVLADSTISGTLTMASPAGGVYAHAGDLTLNGLISGAFPFNSQAALNRTVTISGGISGVTFFSAFGPGTTVWNGSAANAALTQAPSVNGGTLKLVMTAPTGQFVLTAVSNVQLAIGGGATQTGISTSRYTYTGGTLEFSNKDATQSIDYQGLTATNAVNLTRGSGKLKLSRDAAQDFTVTLGNTGQPANGYLTLEYGGTNPGTIGTESNIRFPSLSNGQIRTLIYSPVYSAMVPVWVDPTSRVAYRMLYDGSQNLVAASQAGGTTLTLLTQSGLTYNFGFYNLTGDLTAQVSARVNSIRFDTTTTTPITLAAGAVLQTQELIDVSTGTARTIVAGATGAKLARNVGGSGTFAVYTNNVTSTGATISADMDSRFGQTLTKAGVGLLTLTGAVDNLANFNLSDGSVSFPVGSSFNNPFATLTVANKDSSEAVPATNATFAQSSDVVVAGLSGGGANTTVTLNGGDLVLRSAGTTTFGGDIVLGGSQRLKVQSLSTVPETSSGLQAFQGAFPFTAIEMTRGNISLDPQYGLTFTGASAPSITATGGSTFNIQAQNPLSADYTVALGALTSGVGALRVQLAAATAGGNPYNTRVTAASLTVAGDSVATLLNQTANPQMSFTVTGASAGPMGSGVNVYNGGNIAYYRLAGSTLAGANQNFTGGVALVDTVDVPVYGTGAAGDANFPASKGIGTSFTSSATENINVSGAQSAQTTQTMRSLRISATTITMASSSARLTTDLIIFTSTSPQLLGGEVAAQDVSGNLYVLANGTGVLSSKVTNNGATPTKLLLVSTNGLTLSGANDHSGGTFIQGGGAAVTLTNTSALGTGPVIGNGGSGFLIGASVTTFTFNSGNAITLNAGGMRLEAPAGKDYVLDGKITGGSTGTGDLYLIGAGNYTFGAAFNSGTDTTAGSLRMSSTGTVALNAVQGFTGYDFSSSNTMVFRYGTGITDDISGKLSLRPNNYYRIDTNGNNVTWASSFGNGSTYVKVGAGTHTLGAENFLASCTVSTGTVRAGHVSALGYGTVTLSAGTILQTLTTGGQNGKVTVAALNNTAGGTIRIGG
jgi:fibronectin-binding autotransporter adhesin